MLDEPRFTLGIEEEYLLVDPQTRDLIDEQPRGMLEEGETDIASMRDLQPWPTGTYAEAIERGRAGSGA